MLATSRAEVGRTGVEVSRLGLGGTALSGEQPWMASLPRASMEEAQVLIRHALSLGINYFDTAPMYGLGESERRYGQALGNVPRDRFVLSTKVGRVLVEDGPSVSWAFDFTRTGIQESLESSLERLSLEYVDIAFIHDPDGDVMFDPDSPEYYDQTITEALPALQELQAKGRIRAIGAGMNQWEMELRLAQHGGFDCFLLAGRYTLLDQSALSEFLSYCLEQGISVIAGGPYNSGILAAGPEPASTYNYRTATPEVLEKTRRIAAVCSRYDTPLKAAALQFILAHPAIVSVIPGARSVAEVEDNYRMAQWPIPPDLWSALKQADLIDTRAPVPARQP
jgi:D-threo-aldose 1-dehydrogenase